MFENRKTPVAWNQQKQKQKKRKKENEVCLRLSPCNYDGAFSEND